MNKQINPAAVQHHRRRQDISQEELAERVKDRQERGILSKRHLQRIERKAQLPGPHYVREEVLLALARALRVSPSRLQEVPEDSSQVQTENSGRVPLPPIKVRASTATKLDLVRSAYKVTLEEIIDLAPGPFQSCSSCWTPTSRAPTHGLQRRTSPSGPMMYLAGLLTRRWFKASRSGTTPSPCICKG